MCVLIYFTGRRYYSTSCDEVCLTSGMLLEGTMAVGSLSGVWFQTRLLSNATSGAAFLFDARTTGGIFHFIRFAPLATGNGTGVKVIDRSMRLEHGQAPKFRLVVRNSWTHASMIEFYVNDVLGQAFSLGIRGAQASTAALLTGVFSLINGANITAIHELTLPRQL